MKRSLLSLFCALGAISSHIHAQYTIPNSGFENWTSSTPDSWVPTFETGFSGPSSPFVQSTDKHSGDYALQILNEAGKGAAAELSIPKTGTTLPPKLKGFVKYNIASQQRARIELYLSKKTVSGTSTFTTSDLAGWVTFSGNSGNAYQAFEIDLDYRLTKQIDSLSNGGLDFDNLMIRIKAYGPLTADESDFDDITSDQILDNTYITVDDFSFDGSVANEKIKNATESILPQYFEDWTPMDGGYVPTALVQSGLNAAENINKRTFFRSTDAKSGSYALHVTLAGADTSNGFLLGLIAQPGQKTLNFSVKGTMDMQDSLGVVIADLASDFTLFKAISGADLGTDYQTYSLDISSLTANKLYFVFVEFSRMSTTSTYSVNMDDLVIDNQALGIHDIAYLSTIEASPNPCTNGTFTLSNAAGKSIHIYNAVGIQTSASLKTNGTDVNVDFTEQPKGVYFVNIDGLKTIKMINR